MAKRVKRDDVIEHIKPIEVPYLGQLTDDGPIHIIVETAYFHDKYNRHNHYDITRCKRVTTWAQHIRNVGLRHFGICSRCGTEAEFEKAREDRMVWVQKLDRERKNADLMKQAEYKADYSWTELGEKLEAGIMAEVENIIERDETLIPFSKTQIAYMLDHFNTRSTFTMGYALEAEAEIISKLEGV